MAVPVALAVAAEAAWIAVAAGLVQEYVLGEPVLGLPAFVAFVAAGLVAARLLAARLGERWPLVAVGLIAVGAIGGVLLHPGARAALASAGWFGPGSALAVHPAGTLAGIAVLRGFSHARLPLSDERLARLLGRGIVVISLASLLGGLVADPWRARFLGDTLGAGVVFAAAAVLALALTRQSIVGADSGLDWPRNPVWVALLVVLVIIVVAIAIPMSGIVRPALLVLMGIALGPVLVVGVALGWTRSTLRILGLLALAALAIVVLADLVGGRGTLPPPAAPRAGLGSSEAATDPRILMVGGGVLVALALIVMLVLLRIWMRQVALEPDDVLEQRFIDRGEIGQELGRRRWRLPFRDRPRTAAAAYLALIRDLAPRRGVARLASETPREHARRIRSDGTTSFQLDLLAADYALTSYGGVGLSEREDRRAVERWRSLRRRLKARPLPPTVSAEKPARVFGQRQAAIRVEDQALPPGARASDEPDV